MDIKNGKCSRCYCRDRNRAENEPKLFLKENLIDPGDVPEHLPLLT